VSTPTIAAEFTRPDDWTEAEYTEYLDMYRAIRRQDAITRRRVAISQRARRASDLAAASKWSMPR
jgi:hypothetical protein